MFDELIALVTAVGAVATAVAVVVGVGQLRVANRQLSIAKELAQAAFEDELAREYRAIVAKLPVEAFYGDSRLVPDDPAWRAFYAYVDLSNKQLWLAHEKRITDTTAAHWIDGISDNLTLPAFRSAWDEIAHRVPNGFFGNLKKLVPPTPRPESEPDA